MLHTWQQRKPEFVSQSNLKKMFQQTSGSLEDRSQRILVFLSNWRQTGDKPSCQRWALNKISRMDSSSLFIQVQPNNQNKYVLFYYSIGFFKFLYNLPKTVEVKTTSSYHCTEKHLTCISLKNSYKEFWLFH